MCDPALTTKITSRALIFDRSSSRYDLSRLNGDSPPIYVLLTEVKHAATISGGGFNRQRLVSLSALISVVDKNKNLL
jgi:hypothetical protein